MNEPLASSPPLVVCHGEVLIDLVATGGTGTIEGATRYRKAAGGAPANVAVGVSRLGVQAALTGKVADDPFGRFLRATLERENVDTRGLISDRATRTPLAFVGSDGADGRSWLFYHRGLADTKMRPDEIDAALVASSDIFHFGSVSMAAEPGRSATLFAARTAKEAGAVVSFDPNVRLELWDSPSEARDTILSAMLLVDFIKVSADEIGFVCGTARVEQAAAELLRSGPHVAVITLGSVGAFVATAGWSAAVAGYKVDAVDTTGSGDAFVAGAISCIAPRSRTGTWWTDREMLADAVRFANAAGALAATGYGAIPSLPARAAVDALMARGARPECAAISEQE